MAGAPAAGRALCPFAHALPDDHVPAFHPGVARGAGRITFDHSLAFALPDGTQISLPGVAIVESKGPGQPLPVDRLLWRHGYRPQSISKYALGLSLLVPELPANRWHRIRRDMQAVAVPVERVTSQPALTWGSDISCIDVNVQVPPELQAVSRW